MKKLVMVMLCLMMAVFVCPSTSKAYVENGFSYRVADKKATITGVAKAKVNKETGEKEEQAPTGDLLTIPAEIGGYPVVEIGTSAFQRTKYKEVQIPESVKKIGAYAFYTCKSLKKVTLPSGITRIMDSTFQNCEKLEEIKLGEKVAYIDDSAFLNCAKLKKINFPNSLKEIARWAFAFCIRLQDVKLGNKLKKIGSHAFYQNYDLKSIRIPKSVKTVEDGSFANCIDLERVSFGSAATQLYDGMFTNCKSLKKVSLPGEMKTIPEKMFVNCNSLTQVKIPKNVTIIKKEAFRGCGSLKKVTLNQKMYAIGDRVFSESGLQSIKLGDNMQYIGNGAFRDTKIKTIRLGKKITLIGNQVFASCRNLKVVNIPASVKGIHVGAFQACTSLCAIHVAEGNANYSSKDGVLYNKNKTYLIQYPIHKTNASYISPASLVKIRDHAFGGNAYLKTANISAKSIGEAAFAEMGQLKSVTIQGAKELGANVFYGDDALCNVKLADSVEKIGVRAFSGTRIRTLNIPSALKKLGSDAFEECNQLVAFTGGSSANYVVEDGVLYSKGKTKLLKYPAKKTTREFTVPNTVEAIEGYAFDHTSHLTKISFGKNMKTLEYQSIVHAKQLKSVEFTAKRVKYISHYGIAECGNLAVIVGPNTYSMKWLAQNAKATLISL